MSAFARIAAATLALCLPLVAAGAQAAVTIAIVAGLLWARRKSVS